MNQNVLKSDMKKNTGFGVNVNHFGPKSDMTGSVERIFVIQEMSVLSQSVSDFYLLTNGT